MKETDAIKYILTELDRARQAYPPFHSPHEGFAVLLEEVEELKAEVFKNRETRNLAHMTSEAIDVAAMALRFLTDCCKWWE